MEASVPSVTPSRFPDASPAGAMAPDRGRCLLSHWQSAQWAGLCPWQAPGRLPAGRFRWHSSSGRWSPRSRGSWHRPLRTATGRAEGEAAEGGHAGTGPAPRPVSVRLEQMRSADRRSLGRSEDRVWKANVNGTGILPGRGAEGPEGKREPSLHVGRGSRVGSRGTKASTAQHHLFTPRQASSPPRQRQLTWSFQ